MPPRVRRRKTGATIPLKREELVSNARQPSPRNCEEARGVEIAIFNSDPDKLKDIVLQEAGAGDGQMAGPDTPTDLSGNRRRDNMVKLEEVLSEANMSPVLRQRYPGS